MIRAMKEVKQATASGIERNLIDDILSRSRAFSRSSGIGKRHELYSIELLVMLFIQWRPTETIFMKTSSDNFSGRLKNPLMSEIIVSQEFFKSSGS